MLTDTRSTRVDPFDRFRVDHWVDWMGRFVARRPRLWRLMGDWETRQFADAIHDVEIRAPIFISGLARSGSTILLECLASHPDVVTHRYRDFPGILAPIIWDRIASRLYANGKASVERAHGDGIAITPDSPEAIEEMIWMAFYPDAHDPARDNTLRRGDVRADFATYYRDHIRKLLWLRDGSRYLSKGNYNVARLEGLLEIFPDARFIIPIRDPISHIASLMRQHDLFCAAEARHPAALRYMQHVGHFEFGLDRRPLNLGDDARIAEIERTWQQGRDVEGWALYWAAVHDFLADQLAGNSTLRRAALVVRFERLCEEPIGELRQVHAHAELEIEPDKLDELARRIRAPDYYALPFDQAEQHMIRQLTAAAAAKFGY